MSNESSQETCYIRVQIENNTAVAKKGFSFRACDACNKPLVTNTCKKCSYSLCHRKECKAISEQNVCSPMKSLSEVASTMVSLGTRKQGSTFDLSSYDLLMSNYDLNVSKQILPVTEIKPRAAFGLRSSSASEIEDALHDDLLSFKKKTRGGSNRKRETPQRWDSLVSSEIPFTQIQIDKKSKIGAGAFGTVHKARDFYHGLVAIKFLNVQEPSPERIRAFRNEMKILKATRHDNMLLFIGCILKPNLAMVTEWCPGSSLYRHLHVEQVYWDMGQVIDIAKQIAIGMEYLHARNILHRDLKSNNIFLVPKELNALKNRKKNNNNHTKIEEESEMGKWKVKIGDFGLATFNSESIKSKQSGSPTGSLLWMAPEVISQKVFDPYTPKSDVYSYSVVLYEMITGHLPFQNKEQNMILFLVGSGFLKLTLDDAREDTPAELVDLAKTCSKFKRDERLDFIEINERLSRIELKKKAEAPRILRVQSLPNIYITFDSSSQNQSTDFFYEDIEALTEIDLLNESSFSTSLFNNPTSYQIETTII